MSIIDSPCHPFFLQEENKCHPNPCRNGGICTEANGAYICTCMEGYKGSNCEGILLKHAELLTHDLAIYLLRSPCYNFIVVA